MRKQMAQENGIRSAKARKKKMGKNKYKEMIAELSKKGVQARFDKRVATQKYMVV